MARFQIRTSQLKNNEFIISVSDTKTGEIVTELMSRIKSIGIKIAMERTNKIMKERELDKQNP